MKFFLLKMKVNGIKNIEKEINLNFYNNVLGKTINFKNSHVKAIYGPNGAGKTGLIYAVDLYKNIVTMPNFITLSNANGLFDKIINQNINEFYIELSFASLEKNQIQNVFSHSLHLKKNIEGFYIYEEKLCRLNGKSLNDKSNMVTIFHSKDGEIVDILKECLNKDMIFDTTKNLLSSRSIGNILFLSGKDLKQFDAQIMYYFGVQVSFALNIITVIQDSDKNYIEFNKIETLIKTIEQFKNKLSDNETFYNLLTQNQILLGKTDIVKKENIEEFEKNVRNLCDFIKVFKNDLVTIDIEKDENGDCYECEIFMVYSNNLRISKKFESTGIKRLIELYSALCSLEKGKMVFIDEFDVNIHDVLLVKLVEYVLEYSEGQFVFTTHNLAPMDLLQKFKHSIDFLSSDNRLVSWASNGNYTAANLYSKGLIKYSPFNIEPFNFIGVFGE